MKASLVIGSTEVRVAKAAGHFPDRPAPGTGDPVRRLPEETIRDWVEPARCGRWNEPRMTQLESNVMIRRREAQQYRSSRLAGGAFWQALSCRYPMPAAAQSSEAQSDPEAEGRRTSREEPMDEELSLDPSGKNRAGRDCATSDPGRKANSVGGCAT